MTTEKYNYFKNHDAFLYIQCKDNDGKTGSFIGDENKNSISPVFDNLIELFIWVNHSNFYPKEGQAYSMEYRHK